MSMTTADERRGDRSGPVPGPLSETPFDDSGFSVHDEAPAPRRRLRPGLLLAQLWVAVLVLAAIFADVLPIKKYSEAFVVMPLHKPPHLGLSEPFGSDRFGRSILSRVIYGGRVTLAVGIIAVLIALLIGGALGVLAGYLGGRVDWLLTMITDSMLAFPPIVFLLTMRAVLVNPDRGQFFTIPKLVAILALVAIPNFYRQTRAQVLPRKGQGYVLAAEALGAKRRWIMFRELVPNVILPVASVGLVVMAGLMIAEGSLSLLGFGMPEPQPSWGKMIAEGKAFLQDGEHYHEVVIPIVVMFLTLFSFNVLGEAARKKFDKRSSRL